MAPSAAASSLAAVSFLAPAAVRRRNQPRRHQPHRRRRSPRSHHPSRRCRRPSCCRHQLCRCCRQLSRRRCQPFRRCSFTTDDTSLLATTSLLAAVSMLAADSLLDAAILLAAASFVATSIITVTARRHPSSMSAVSRQRRRHRCRPPRRSPPLAPSCLCAPVMLLSCATRVHVQRAHPLPPRSRSTHGCGLICMRLELGTRVFCTPPHL